MAYIKSPFLLTCLLPGCEVVYSSRSVLKFSGHLLLPLSGQITHNIGVGMLGFGVRLLGKRGQQRRYTEVKMFCSVGRLVQPARRDYWSTVKDADQKAYPVLQLRIF